MSSRSHVFLMVFFLALFEAGGHRPQPQGLRASESRKAFRLGVKTYGVPLGFKRSKGFCLVFIQNNSNYSFIN